MTAEIAAAIASFYYSNNVTDSAKKTYREGWTKAITGYETNEDMKNFVDLFQSTVRENNSKSDWFICLPFSMIAVALKALWIGLNLILNML